MSLSPLTLDCSALEIRRDLIANLHAPSAVERENLWNAAVETYRSAILQGHKAGALKKELASWLWHRVPALGKSPAAIFRQLYRKIDRIAEAGSLTDKRREANQERRAPMLSKEDRTALIQKAVFECGGLIDFAWQKCVGEKLLSAEILTRYPARKDRRPRCPQNIRSQIQSNVDELYQHNARPHWNSNNIAPLTRDWSNVYAQDIYQCDDKTLDVLYRSTTEENGKQVERENRAQFLPMIDVKSGKILDFVLIGESNYNSIAVRTLMSRVCKKYGKPSMFLFECGIFKSGKLLGNNATGKPFAEVENVGKRIGSPIHHALPGRARTKIVETIFRLLDRKMYGWPGYIGNDEMHRKFERSRDNGLMTFDELYARLVAAVEDYNNTKSDSIVKGGYLSPNEVWENCRRKDDLGNVLPEVKLPAEFEYLLAEHCAEVTVREYGVKTTVGRAVFQFHSNELVDFMSGMIGQTVKVWFDPGNPETGIVSDLKEQKFIPVKRVPMAPAVAVTPADWQMFADASAPHRTHMKQLRQHYSDLKATYMPPFRATVADAPARVKAQARSDAKTKGEQTFARQVEPMESRAEREEKRIARREALAVLEAETAQYRY